MSSKESHHDEIAESLRRMDIDEDLAWVLDSLIGFLKSPIWTTSLNNFVDQHSVVFEPEEIETNDGKIRIIPEYEVIYEEYRGLVDRLITTHMTELGINEKAFAMACEMADGILAGRLKAFLFEELWAAENYEVFTRWMAKRNVELQLEALNTLATRHGMVYDVFVPFESDVSDFLPGKKSDKKDESDLKEDKNEDETFQDKRKLSQQIEVEAEVIHSKGSLDQAEIEPETLKVDKNRLEEVRNRVENQIQESLLTILKTPPESEIGSKSSSENVTETSPSETHQQDVQDSGNKSEKLNNLKDLLSDQTNSVNQKLKSAEIEKRAEYLRAQRDKIIALRAKERTEHISKYIKGKGKNASGLGEGKSNNVEVDSTSPKDEENNNSELAYRKSLAARLKAEIGGFSSDKKLS